MSFSGEVFFAELLSLIGDSLLGNVIFVIPPHGFDYVIDVVHINVFKLLFDVIKEFLPVDVAFALEVD